MNSSMIANAYPNAPDGLPLAAVLPLVLELTPKMLVSDAARVRLLRCADYLPRFRQIGGMEFRLHQDEQVDLGCFADRTHAAEVADWLMLALQQQAGLAEQPAWWALLSFLRQWALPNQPTSAIEYTALEADVLPDVARTPVPMMFFYVDTVGATSIACDALQTAIAHMTDVGQATKCMGFLQPCFAAMQGDDVLRGVGIMTGRDTADGVRLLLKLKPDRVLPYLQAVAWGGSLDEIDRLLSLLRVSQTEASVLVYLDVAERIGPKLGIGRLVGESNFKSYKLQLQTLLDGFVAEHWCDAEKAQALMQMSKRLVHPGNASQPWPMSLLQQAQYRFPPAVSQFSHSVLSFKVIHDARTGASVAKAYTCFRHHWYSAALGWSTNHQSS